MRKTLNLRIALARRQRLEERLSLERCVAAFNASSDMTGLYMDQTGCLQIKPEPVVERVEIEPRSSPIQRFADWLGIA